MIRPSLEEFRSLARPGALVPVYKEIVADLETPVSAYMRIAKDQQCAFLLESVDQADTIGRYSFIGANPSIVFRSKGNQVRITRPGGTETFESDDALDAWMMRQVTTSHHISGTCKMGLESDSMAVVDQYGRVHGLQALRVVDASIMPDLVRAPINPAVIMIGERVADLIQQGY